MPQQLQKVAAAHLSADGVAPMSGPVLSGLKPDVALTAGSTGDNRRV